MNPSEPTTLFQVFYVSHSVASVPDLQAILSECLRNNPARALTGALLFTGGAFAQVLEGPQAAVQSMCETLAADPRHQGMRWLLKHETGQRSFGGWSMKPLEAPGADDLVQQLLLSSPVTAQRAERLLKLMFELPAAAPHPSSVGRV